MHFKEHVTRIWIAYWTLKLAQWPVFKYVSKLNCFLWNLYNALLVKVVASLRLLLSLYVIFNIYKNVFSSIKSIIEVLYNFFKHRRLLLSRCWSAHKREAISKDAQKWASRWRIWQTITNGFGGRTSSSTGNLSCKRCTRTLWTVTLNGMWKRFISFSHFQFLFFYFLFSSR